MSTALAEIPMARKKRNDTSVKVDAEVIRMAKITAAIRGTSVAEYLSTLLRPLVEKDHKEAVASEAAAKARLPRPPKR